jgi:DNA-binding PadR family transcriptional regulator
MALGDIFTWMSTRMMNADLRSQLPLTETTLLILLSLAPGPNHGYAIMKDVTDLSEGRVKLSTGTLYGALARLLELDWIERVERADADETGRPRKDYILTESGQRVLNMELGRLKALISVASLRVARGEA